MSRTLNHIPVFQNRRRDKTLQKDGIVKFKLGNGFNAQKCINLLESLVHGYPDNLDQEFYGSVFISDINLKKQIHQELQDLIEPYLSNQFINHKLLSYFFLVKGKGAQSKLNLHQDWSIVDERKYSGYNLWIPLSKSTIENGTLHVLKGSHHFPLNIRGAGIEPKYFSHFDKASQYMQAVEVNVDEALLFNSRLLHYSPVNKTAIPRTAIINNLIPEMAEIFCFHGEKSNGTYTVNQYAVPDDLFIHYDDFMNQKELPNPKGKFMQTIDYANTDLISDLDFQQLIQNHVRKKRWYQF